jgi:peptidoglycan hydrolase-like protein with peptidoglycan-binding domain
LRFRLLRSIAVLLILALLSAGAAWGRSAKNTRSGKTSVSKSTHKKTVRKTRRRRHTRRASWKHRGQQHIDGARVRQIQSALIREGYLSGEPDGAWDSQTKDAMARYQSDNGWQTKMLPDSRALIKLGLGPDLSNALNAQNIQLHPVAPEASGDKAASNSTER